MARGDGSASAAGRGRPRSAWVWLGLGWLGVLTWLAMLAVNAAPYLGGRQWPPASVLLPRLLAPPAALGLPAALAAQATPLLTALAIFLIIVVTALTISSRPRVSAAPAISTPAPTPQPSAERALEPAAEAVSDAPEPTPPAALAEVAPEPAPAPEPPAPTSQRTAFTPRVFISHSSADNGFGFWLETRLKEALGDSDAVFYDRDGGLVGGDEWVKTLQYEIGRRDVFVLLLSPQALASGWVEREVSYALRQAVSVGGKVIVPVLYQDVDVWPFLQDYQMVDFRKPDAFDAAFADLLAAVCLGRSRMMELRGLRGVRRGPPFDLERLPLPERFIGRVTDIEWALGRLAPDLNLTAPPTIGGHAASGLASIAAANGLAGIGKSALAGALVRILYATNRYPDGIAVVACNGLSDPVAVLRATLTRFDPDGREPPEDTVDALSEVAKGVFARLPRALVVLDNVEPELPAERVTKPLRVAGAALLLTSRQRLPTSAVPADDCHQLDLLSLAEAVAVFIENRERVTAPAEASADAAPAPGSAVGQPGADERAAIEGIVTALGRHTLAVKLAAARARGRDLAALARAYAANPRLGVNLRDGLEAVDVVMSSSVAALPAPARLLFVTLGAFASDDIGRAALLSVGAELDIVDPQSALDAILDLRLADAILATNLSGEEVDTERLRLHPLTHGYAGVLLLQAPGEWDESYRTRCLKAVASFYASYTRSIRFQIRALLWDQRNILGALDWAQANGADDEFIAICLGMRDSFSQNNARELLARIPRAIEILEGRLDEDEQENSRPAMAVVALMLSYANELNYHGGFQEATDILSRARTYVALYSSLPESKVDSIMIQSALMYIQAIQSFELPVRAVDLIPFVTGPKMRAFLKTAGVDATAFGSTMRALFGGTFSLMADYANATDQAMSTAYLDALTAIFQLKLKDASAHLERLVQHIRHSGDLDGLDIIYLFLGQVAIAERKWEIAGKYLYSALEVANEIGASEDLDVIYRELGTVSMSINQPGKAVQHYLRALREAELQGNGFQYAHMAFDVISSLSQHGVRLSDEEHIVARATEYLTNAGLTGDAQRLEAQFQSLMDGGALIEASETSNPVDDD